MFEHVVRSALVDAMLFQHDVIHRKIIARGAEMDNNGPMDILINWL